MTRQCLSCGETGMHWDWIYCPFCSAELPKYEGKEAVKALRRLRKSVLEGKHK